ncbi:hypothetical protein OCH239_00345 [Roseivivax halodurans JCM 10272]|uniref:Uncharacterized protein n=1 Tax=Roseivivax halodurans JCM 10272 TaxID=1449350 RepID=X7EL94_9RHOB|nr:hypothetical protein [Roseivivax halodurans]ETX16707.1 hypothetical protein OCH239_00345 [Roseivivax halodurans JCM 10272]
MERFAYLVDEAELGDVRPDWPAGVSVALCLDAEGEAGLVLFENGAHDGLAERISEATGWEGGSFAVAPQIEGCPTLRPLFSQAQDFLHIVARFDGLDDMAQRFLHGEEAAPLPARMSPEAQVKSRLTLSLPQGKPDFPAGYRSADELSGGPMAFVQARIRTAKDRVQVVLAPEKAGRRTPTHRVSHVGVRDDLRCFVVPPDVLGDCRPGRSLILDIPEECFPAALAAWLKASDGAADVTVTREGVFVTPVVAAGLRRPARKGPRGALRATLLAGVAMGLLSGSVVSALQDGTEPRDNILAYRSAVGHSGLNVLESFARSKDSSEQAGN